MSVKIKFGSGQAERTASRKVERLTFYSPDRAELEQYIAGHYPEGGDTPIGQVVQTRYYQDGPCWYCDVIAETDYADDGITILVRGKTRPLAHSLRTVCCPVSPARLQNYRTCWDHYLWKEIPLSEQDLAHSAPAGYETRTDDTEFRVQSVRYAWTESASPPALVCADGHIWRQIPGCPVKPGIRDIPFYTYEIREYGEYDRSALNKPAVRPILGTFGIQGGSWKVVDASLLFDSRHWKASLVWLWDSSGWDTDLYPPQLKEN